MQIFENSAGWKAERAELDPEVGAVDLLADPRQARRQQQQQADRGDRVPVALEHVVVAQELDRQREEDEAEDEPVRLVAGEGGVDPVDHHQAEGGQQGGQREEVGVGVGEPDPQVDVGGKADREKVGAVDQAEVAEPRVLLGKDRGETGGEEQRDGDQGGQLAVAGRAHQIPAPRSLILTAGGAHPRGPRVVCSAGPVGG